MSDDPPLPDDDCPFFDQGEPPKTPERPILGACVHCGGDAETVDSRDRLACYPCAYSDASW